MTSIEMIRKLLKDNQHNLKLDMDFWKYEVLLNQIEGSLRVRTEYIHDLEETVMMYRYELGEKLDGDMLEEEEETEEIDDRPCEPEDAWDYQEDEAMERVFGIID